MPYQLQVTINGQVHVLPASVLTSEGTQAVINMMAAQSPPPPPQNQNQHQHLHLHHHQLHSEQQLAPSGPEAAWFTAAELAGMANGVFPEPEDDQHDHHHHQPASASPPHLTTPTPSPPRRHQPAARHHHRHNNNSKTPLHFPGYRWVAQSIALRQGPAVQLGTIYGAMAAMWPDHFSASSPASASWKSGVRHAVLKHFKRVGGGGAAGGGVWYQPDPENLMTAEEARRVVEGRGGRRRGGRV